MLVPANPHKPLALHFDKNACVPHTLGLQTGALETVLWSNFPINDDS